MTLQDYKNRILYNKAMKQSQGTAGSSYLLLIISLLIDSIQEQGQYTPIKSYTFGEYIKKEQKQFYKVQQNGKITIKVNHIYNNINLKNTEYVIQLDKIQQISEVESIKLAQRRTEKKFKIQMNKLQRENQQLKIRIQVLQNQISDQNFFQRIGKLENSVAFKSLMSEVSQLLPQYSINNFRIYNNRQVKFQGINTWNKFIFNKVIPFYEEYIFRIKITASSRHIYIGVLDYNLQKYSVSSVDVCYNGDGVKYPGGLSQGEGFQNGQTVQVRVNLYQKTIKWLVEGNLKASLTTNILGDNTRKFMPYVNMYVLNDMVEWV